MTVSQTSKPIECVHCLQVIRIEASLGPEALIECPICGGVFKLKLALAEGAPLARVVDTAPDSEPAHSAGHPLKHAANQEIAAREIAAQEMAYAARNPVGKPATGKLTPRPNSRSRHPDTRFAERSPVVSPLASSPPVGSPLVGSPPSDKAASDRGPAESLPNLAAATLGSETDRSKSPGGRVKFTDQVGAVQEIARALVEGEPRPGEGSPTQQASPGAGIEAEQRSMASDSSAGESRSQVSRSRKSSDRESRSGSGGSSRSSSRRSSSEGSGSRRSRRSSSSSRSRSVRGLAGQRQKGDDGWNEIGVDGLPVNPRPVLTGEPEVYSTWREVVVILLGGLVSLPITQLCLWWLVGIDPLGLAPQVSELVPQVVPAQMKPETPMASSMLTDSNTPDRLPG